VLPDTLQRPRQEFSPSTQPLGAPGLASFEIRRVPHPSRFSKGGIPRTLTAFGWRSVAVRSEPAFGSMGWRAFRGTTAKQKRRLGPRNDRFSRVETRFSLPFIL